MIRLLTCLLLTTSVAWGEDVREALQRGNEAYSNERFDEAFEVYEQIETPQEPLVQLDLEHNRAATEFKLGRLDDARARWTRIASQGDAAFEAEARYNLGNVDFASARQAVEQAMQQSQGDGAFADDEQAVEPPNPFELLDRAIANYRDALRLNRGFDDARANLELAARFKQELEDQSEPQSQPSEDQQDQDQQDQDQDQQEGEDGEQNQDQQQSDQEQDSDEQQDQQQDSEQQNQEGQDGQDQQDQQQQDGQQNEQDQEDEQQQDEPQQGEDQQQPEQQEPQQAEPAEAQPAEPAKLTKEEAARLLQAIREAEQKRRAILRAREAAKHKPAEKDW